MRIQLQSRLLGMHICMWWSHIRVNAMHAELQPGLLHLPHLCSDRVRDPYMHARRQSAVRHVHRVRSGIVSIRRLQREPKHAMLSVRNVRVWNVRDDSLHTVHESRLHAVHDDLQRQLVRDDGVHGGGESRVRHL